jgi:predicted dehydrogenase
MTIKIGVIGAGFIGPAHVEAVRRLGDVEGVTEHTPRTTYSVLRVSCQDHLCIGKV